MRIMKLYGPMAGINTNWSATTQPKYTSPDMLNVRPRSVLDERAIIGQRPPMVKAYSQDLSEGANLPVVAICQVTVVEV